MKLDWWISLSGPGLGPLARHVAFVFAVFAVFAEEAHAAPRHHASLPASAISCRSLCISFLYITRAKINRLSVLAPAAHSSSVIHRIQLGQL